MELSESEKKLLKPIIYTGRRFYIFLAALFALLIWGFYAWYTQLRYGLVITGLRDIGVGPPWGLYVSNFIFFIGMAHGGIAISAAVRIAGLRTYKPITRIAEFLTPISLLMAALSILFDLGRPDRIFHLMIYYLERLGQSPLVWDWTVITIYFTLSVIYIFLLIRKDVAFCVQHFPRWRWLYKLLLVGYIAEEKEKVEKLAWWMALVIPTLLVLLSGGVIAWLLGLMIARPGWYGAFMGPYFVVAAVASALAAVIVVSAIFRRVFKWDEFIRPEIFRGLGNFLAALMFFYLYFMFAEHITMQYPGPQPTPELSVSQAILTGEFAWIFWSMTIIFFVVPTLSLFTQVVLKKFSLTVTTMSAIAILIGLWIKRVLIVVPPLTRSLLPYPIGAYTPTWVEWSLVIATLALATLLYTLVIKVIPAIEVKQD
ncbi:MAG: NrfD/PsrC family molybdoenzyme membrane anchor subunit [Nitrososphaerales archaeon]